MGSVVAGLTAVRQGGARLEGAGEVLQPACVQRVHVGADEHEHLARGMPAAQVECPPERELLGSDVNDLDAVALGDGNGVVGRSRVDEDDLLGGFRLINGNTVWQDGPVVSAMKNGGVLLLDEVDLASRNIMCLQPVLEGKGVFQKKIGQWVTPAEGFQVFATANTKGK